MRTPRGLRSTRSSATKTIATKIAFSMWPPIPSTIGPMWSTGLPKWLSPPM
jgi:hypothetical protein